MKRRRTDDSFLLLSLLDLFACGLGAALILGFILMLAREGQAVDASPSAGAMLEFRVEDDDALFTFLIKPPGNARVVELGRDDLESGRPLECGRHSGFTCVLLGWSRDGNRSMAPAGGENGEKPGGRSYLLFLSGPATISGDSIWEVGVRYFSRDEDWAAWFGRDAGLKPVKMRDFRLYSTTGKVDCDLATSEVAFGQEHRCKVDVRLQ